MLLIAGWSTSRPAHEPYGDRPGEGTWARPGAAEGSFVGDGASNHHECLVSPELCCVVATLAISAVRRWTCSTCQAWPGPDRIAADGAGRAVCGESALGE